MLDSSRPPSYLSVPESRNDNATSSSSNTLTSKANSYSSFHYRQNAMALMEQIKSDMKGQKRLFSSDTEASTITTQTDDNTDSYNRSALASAVHRRKAKGEEQENHNAHGHRRSSSSRSNSFRTRSTPKKQHSRTIPSEEINQALAAHLSQMSVSDRKANNNAAPSNTEGQAQPEPRPPSTLAPPSYPSSSIRGTNEDLNRFVSSSTASGTTMTAGSAPSFVKHAGPPQLRTIAPTDLPSLPERMGDMLFDKVMMKWVKNTAQATRDPDKSALSSAEVSDDPFGDIESLHDDSPGVDARHNEFGLEAAEDQDAPRAPVAEMSAIEERSEAEDDEEFELTSFSTDASAHVVDIMTGVDSTGYHDGDETTDSEDDFDSTVTGTGPVAVVDYESGDEDLSPTNEAYPQPIEPIATPAPPQTSLSLPLVPAGALHTPNKRAGGSVAATPIRSVLKSSGTPNSAMKSRSRYETPQSRHRRSVSFSDGKLEGPIQDLASSTDTEPSSVRVYDVTAITQPSVRSKRIADLMDALVNSGLSDSLTAV